MVLDPRPPAGLSNTAGGDSVSRDGLRISGCSSKVPWTGGFKSRDGFLILHVAGLTSAKASFWGFSWAAAPVSSQCLSPLSDTSEVGHLLPG